MPKGFVVKTAQGRKGLTYNHEAPVNGKTVVHLLGDDYKPLKDKDGKPIKVTADPNTLTVIGRVD